jgi:DNA-binding response OmpR family regulator
MGMLHRTNKKKTNDKHCKVIFLSAKNKKDIEKGLQLGANLYCYQTFSVKKLVDQVQN